jgi:hypothetical protein
MIRDRKAISMGGVLAITTLAVFVALAVWVVSPALMKIAGGGRASVSITGVGRVGANLIRLTILNDGEVSVRIQEVTVTDTGISGSVAPGVKIDPGSSKEVDVGFTSDLPISAVTLNVKIKTDKGEFTFQVSLPAGS